MQEDEEAIAIFGRVGLEAIAAAETFMKEAAEKVPDVLEFFNAQDRLVIYETFKCGWLVGWAAREQKLKNEQVGSVG